MVDLDPQKKMRMAMNGRMALMFGGIFLIFTAITSTIMYGINMFMIASEASKGTEEYVEMLETADLSISFIRVVGVLFIILAAVEIFSGVFSLRLSNRVDKSRTTRKIVIALLVVEVLMQIFLLVVRMLNPGMIITAIGLPLFMLWGVTRLTKLSQAEPERVYAVNTKKGPARSKQAQSKTAGQKSLRERAMMKVSDSPVSKPKETISQSPSTEDTSTDVPSGEEASADHSSPEETPSK